MNVFVPQFSWVSSSPGSGERPEPGVHRSGGGRQSIQAAIDGAATGATVCVGPGSYQENLLINKDGITLKGAGPEETVLEPPTQPRPFCPVLQIPPIGGENFGLNGICVADLDPRVRYFGQ